MCEHTVPTLFNQVYDFIEEAVLPPLHWDKFTAILENYRTRRVSTLYAYVDVLPILTCVAAGGHSERAIPLAAAWVFYILAARIFDDLQDDEGADHPWNEGGLQEALPTGLYAMGAAQSALSHLSGNGDKVTEITRAFGNALALSAKAQCEEPLLDNLSVEWYFRILAAKTGIILATGARAGALLSLKPTDSSVIDALYQYGLNTGMAAQIADDCYDLVACDLTNNSLSLPIIYGLAQKQHAQYSLFLTALRDSSEESARVARIVEFLKEVGAIDWSLKVASVYQGRALAALKQFPEEKVRPLVHYVSRNLAVSY